jgi:hypothetical protein
MRDELKRPRETPSGAFKLYDPTEDAARYDRQTADGYG